jgi:hypothetical protein
LTKVVLVLEVSAWAAAVMVTLCAVAGAVQIPAGVMVPALADQFTAVSVEPDTVALKVVAVPTVTVGLAGVMAPMETTGVATTVTVVVLVLEVSAWAAAVMVTVPDVVGAVQIPAGVMVPALALQFTAVSALPVTVAANCVVVPVCTVGLAGVMALTATPSTTFTVVVDFLAVSAWAVAVIVTVWAVAGAVQAPVLAFMVPALALQVMAVLVLPVTVALKVVLLPTLTVLLAGVMALTTTFEVGVVVVGAEPPPLPQARQRRRDRHKVPERRGRGDGKAGMGAPKWDSKNLPPLNTMSR